MAGTVSGGGLMMAGSTAITGVMWVGVTWDTVAGAGSRAGPVYLSMAVVADVGHSGPSLT